MSSLARTGTNAVDALKLVMQIASLSINAIGASRSFKIQSRFVCGCSQLCTTNEKFFYRRDVTRAFERRQTLPDAPAISLGNQARIANHQHALVTFISNQATGALFQIN